MIGLQAVVVSWGNRTWVYTLTLSLPNVDGTDWLCRFEGLDENLYLVIRSSI